MDKIKSQKQLNIQTEDRWDASCIHVDVPSLQKEDYQLQMLQNNRIRGLLELSVTGREEGSRYTYKTLNGASLEERYRMEAMEKKEILELTEQLLSLGEKVKEYLLDPNRILLMPQCIFKIRGEYNFCYLPIEYQSFCEAYHGLAWEVEPLDSNVSDTVRIAYGNSASLGSTGSNALSANAPCPISRRPGPLEGLVSPTE